MKQVPILLAFLLLLLGGELIAHSGGTNANGCHTNRKTGDYHCPNAKTPSPSRVTYCHVSNVEKRCGYALRTCQDLQQKFGGSCQVE